MDIKSLDPNKSCLGFALRSASRALSQRYDQALASIGLRSTQFNLLAGLARHKTKTLSQLAILLVMDRTTLTRNLKPLQKAGWILQISTPDKRSRPYALSPDGEKVFEKAYPIWLDFQKKLQELLGQSYYENLLKELQHVTEKSKNLI